MQRIACFRTIWLATLVSLLMPLFGCVSLGEVTVGREGKLELLSKRVDLFHKSVYWGKIDDAQLFALPESSSKIVDRAQLNRRVERLVDLEIESTELNEADDTASVDVRVRFFRTPSYIVKTKRQREIWAFKRFQGGWFLKSIEETERAKVELQEGEEG